MFQWQSLQVDTHKEKQSLNPFSDSFDADKLRKMLTNKVYTYHNTFAAVRENGNVRTTQTTGDLTLGLSPRCEQPLARRRWGATYVTSVMSYSRLRGIFYLVVLDLLVANNMLTKLTNTISSTGKELMTVWRQYSLVPYSLWVKDHFTLSHFYNFSKSLPLMSHQTR